MKQRIVVAKDGSGDVTSVAEAAVLVPPENRDWVTVYIKQGVYKERVEWTSPYVILEGEDAENTIITNNLYAKMDMGDGMKRGTFRTYTVFIDTHDVIIKNLTIENSAGPGTEMGQAIALYADGDRLIFEDCRILANQDTLFTGPLPPKEIEKNGFIGPKQYAPRINGRHYYKGCLIRGEVDFIFGSATAYFEGCELFSVNTGQEINGYVTAASTPEGQEYGYVFRHCRFTSDCPPETVYLGRPWRDFARTVIVNSELGAHICKEGWHDWDKAHARKNVFFGEYGNTGAGSDMKYRPKWVISMTEQEAERFSAEAVLSGNDGWNPEKWL